MALSVHARLWPLYVAALVVGVVSPLAGSIVALVLGSLEVVQRLLEHRMEHLREVHLRDRERASESFEDVGKKLTERLSQLEHKAGWGNRPGAVK